MLPVVQPAVGDVHYGDLEAVPRLHVVLLGEASVPHLRLAMPTTGGVGLHATVTLVA